MVTTRAAHSGISAPRLQILLAEDNPRDAMLCLRELKEQGFEPVADVVGTREEFLEKLHSKTYDIVLADDRIPGWSGLGALAAVQAEHKEIPFILVTGTLGEEKAAECIKQGATDYVLKDRLTRLPTAVRKALEEKALRDERARAEESVRDSEKRFRAVTEYSSDGFALVAPDGTYIYSTPATNGVLGYDPKELAGLNVFELVHPEDGQSAKRLFVQVAAEAGRVMTGQFRLRHKDGSWRWIEAIGKNLLEEPSVASIVINYRDITQRKRSEDELVASEERFRKAFNASPEPMFISHWPDGRYVDCNERFLRVTGYRREEVIGRTASDVRFWPSAADRDEFARRLEHDRRVKDLEVRFGSKLGDERVGLVSAEMIELRGEPCVLAVTKDITERRSLEEQLRLSQKMEAIGQLAGGVAHDFNNLLTIILGYSVMVINSLEDGDPRRPQLEQVKKAGDQAADLTQQLLAFSRRQVLELQVLDLNTVVAEAEKMLRRLIGEDIELVTVRGRDLGHVKADRSQIQQVILNLVVNARDAMPSGGKLTIETANVELDEAYASWHADVASGPYVMLAVSDTGHGMDEATRARIFEPFFTTKEKGKGTGLGLAVVYGVVKQNAGSIWVYSELGLGTTFKVYFPMVAAAPLQGITAPVRRRSFQGTGTVLLVEDEAAVRTLVRDILECDGYTVLEASQAEEAIEMLERHAGPIDLLLTDVVMPKMSGRELSDRMKSIRPESKVLYMSGYTDTAMAHHGLLEQGVVLVQKPFTPETLSRKVREVLGG